MLLLNTNVTYFYNKPHAILDTSALGYKAPTFIMTWYKRLFFREKSYFFMYKRRKKVISLSINSVSLLPFFLYNV